jgi:hypothetical protein
MNNRLKIGLLVDGELVPKHIADLVSWAGQHDELHISHLIVQERGSRRPRRRQVSESPEPGASYQLLSALRFGLWKLINDYEAHRLGRRGEHAGALRLHDLGRLIEDRIDIAPEISRSGFVHRFRDGDLEKIKREAFDLLIHGGSGILKGGILESSRLGILSFHYGDNRSFRGGPAGFWEVYRRDPRTGFSLQILTEELDGGKIVARGHFPTQSYYLANQKHLQERATQYLKTVLLKIAATRELPPAEPSTPYAGVLNKLPNVPELMRYASMQALRFLRKFWFTCVGIQDRWHVAYCRVGWRDAVLWRGVRIEDQGGRFLADPFVFDRGGVVYCFVEDYSYRTAKGQISVFEIADSGSRYLGVAIEEPYHLSFPFLFEFDGALYMCPETAGAGEIRVYQCKQLPLGWEFVATLMKGVNAVDTMLFEADGRWWMLTNLDSSQIGDRCPELHLFFADNPLSHDWAPHPLNPLIVDSGRARNAGLILDGGKIFRVAQVHGGADDYGAGAKVFEITRLNRQEYEEALVCTLTPSFGPGITGIHHLHTDGRYTVWDFKTRERVS